MNRYGVSWCVICGLLSTKPGDLVNDNDLLLITND